MLSAVAQRGRLVLVHGTARLSTHRLDVVGRQGVEVAEVIGADFPLFPVQFLYQRIVHFHVEIENSAVASRARCGLARIC